MGSIELPHAYRYLWSVYRNLSNRRCYSDGNPLAISFCEIESYSRLTKTPLDSWEVAIITALDDHERGLMYEDIRNRQNKGKLKR